MQQLGLTDADGMAKAWFVSAESELTGGAEAINQALSYCWWARPLTWLYPLPGMARLQGAIYQWIADNRYRLPGSTPECGIAPNVDPPAPPA